MSTVDWVLAEFIRLYHSVSANDAKAIVDDIVTRVAPIIQDFGGALKVLKPGLGASDHCLVLLYQCGEKGATFEQLREWVEARDAPESEAHAHNDGRRAGPGPL